MALMSERSWSDWIAEYSKSHRHPVNRLCHTIGIPAIVVAVALFAAAPFVHALRRRVRAGVQDALELIGISDRNMPGHGQSRIMHAGRSTSGGARFGTAAADRAVGTIRNEGEMRGWREARSSG